MKTKCQHTDLYKKKKNETKQIEIKDVEGPHQRKENKEILPTPSPIKMMAKNQSNTNKGRSCDTRNIKERVSLMENKISKVKLNVLSPNNV